MHQVLEYWWIIRSNRAPESMNALVTGARGVMGYDAKVVGYRLSQVDKWTRRYWASCLERQTQVKHQKIETPNIGEKLRVRNECTRIPCCDTSMGCYRVIWWLSVDRHLLSLQLQTKETQETIIRRFTAAWWANHTATLRKPGIGHMTILFFFSLRSLSLEYSFSILQTYSPDIQQ